MWPDKRGGLIKGVAFDWSGLIRGVAFNWSGLIREVAFDGDVLYLEWPNKRGGL